MELGRDILQAIGFWISVPLHLLPAIWPVFVPAFLVGPLVAVMHRFAKARYGIERVPWGTWSPLRLALVVGVYGIVGMYFLIAASFFVFVLLVVLLT